MSRPTTLNKGPERSPQTAMPRHPGPTISALFGVLLCSLATTGCGYHWGVVARDDVRSVAIPVFSNQTLRRGFERDLTRAVQREVKETTPYLLANRDHADWIILGEIVAIEENVLIEGSEDQVLENLVRVHVSIKIIDRQNQVVPIARQSQAGGRSDGSVLLTDQAEFVTSRGEDRNSATRESIKELAERITQLISGLPL